MCLKKLLKYNIFKYLNFENSTFINASNHKNYRLYSLIVIFVDIFSDKERSVQMSRATSPQSVIVGRPPTNATLVARFCRERAPRTCEHALLRKSRACAKTESFLSKGDSLTLELKLTQGTALK